MTYSLTNKKILITGATSGVGKALTLSLMKKNHIIAVGRNPKSLEWLAQQSDTIETRLIDLSTPQQVNSAAAEIAQDHPDLDVLINNAAVQHEATFLAPDFHPASIEIEVATNFTSVCQLIHALLPSLLRTEGRIVNINSALAITPKTSSAVYCATKSALRSLSRSLRYQLADRNVKVLEAYLPLVETAMTQGRGTGKLSAEGAAARIISGIIADIEENNIGKVKLLRLIHRLSPPLAAKILIAA